jgi:hypothetical protein
MLVISLIIAISTPLSPLVVVVVVVVVAVVGFCFTQKIGFPNQWQSDRFCYFN